MKFIDKKEFAKVALDENFKTFLIYIVALKAETSIYLSWVVQIATLQWNKTSIKNPVDYFDYAKVFSIDLGMKLPENTSMNKHTIELIEGK